MHSFETMKRRPLQTMGVFEWEEGGLEKLETGFGASSESSSTLQCDGFITRKGRETPLETMKRRLL